MLKITLVGAGSVVFAKNLICDILQFPALADCTLCLMDIDAARLPVIEELTRRVIAQLGVKARVESTTDLRRACAGAKFVITTIQVGGYRPSTVADFEIPARYGVKQTIADTLGVGGVFRALRSIGPLSEVARTLAEVGAADPLLLNYTNPMAINMWAIDRLTGLPAVGLCHSVQGTSRQIAGYCGLDPQDVSYLVAGINHMAFFLKFQFKGKDAYPLLFRALEENPAVVSCDRVRFEMMRRLGYFVTESSEHQSEYVPYFIHHGQGVIDEFAIPIDEYLRRCESILKTWRATEASLLEESKPVAITQSVEYGSTILNSVISGTPSVIYGNVPNRGLITNLRAGCCVEVPCLVDRQGLAPTHIGALPPQLAAIIETNVNVQELTVEAAITGRRDHIYQAVMMDPHTASVLPLDKIWAMCDELIEAHQRDGFLGEFKPVMKNTGKPLEAVSRVFLSVQPVGVPFAGGRTRAAFELVAENRTSRAFEGEAAVRVEGGPAEVLPGGPFAVRVGAGETVRLPFEVEREGETAEALRLVIDSASLETIERDLPLPAREQVVLPVDPSGNRRAEVEVRWSGNPLAQVRLGLTPEELLLEARVEDTDVKIDPECLWRGSAVELAFCDPALPQAPIQVVALWPDPENPRLASSERYTAGKAFQGGSATVCRDSGGYTLSARVGLEAVGLAPGRPFLFEMVFHVNALGTAHGKIRHAWRGSASPKTDGSRFALLIPEE